MKAFKEDTFMVVKQRSEQIRAKNNFEVTMTLS